MSNSVLNFFDKLDSNRAKCVFCSDIIYYNRSHKLTHHLKIKHSDSIDWRVLLQSESNIRKRSSRNLSVTVTNKHLWSNFTKADVHQKLAKCNVCEKILSYKTTIANLRIHLKRKHPEVCENNENKIENDENNHEEPGPSDTSMWGSFEKHSDNTGSCNLCLKTLPWNNVALKDHLETHHRLNKNEENNSDSDEQNCYTEIVYLEDEEQTTKKMDPRLEDPKTRQEPKKNRISYEPVDSENEEIENFGKYVTSLLKKLPKDLCTQLQMDIINLIMTAKLNKMAKHLAPSLTSASVGNASFIVTLPKVPVGNSSEGIKSFNRDSNLETL
ncbi:uncharacterized protein LOC124541748 [Vanessa cardui]|uniref:uncharacterized protein LOC124541748 n=1 Tax=Vanessa cardui TaxID=171605 RepID=UPI001F13F211|nr:uncharacterized protein LOC124541748 [Vanessa cardui]